MKRPLKQIVCVVISAEPHNSLKGVTAKLISGFRGIHENTEQEVEFLAFGNFVSFVTVVISDSVKGNFNRE